MNLSLLIIKIKKKVNLIWPKIIWMKWDNRKRKLIKIITRRKAWVMTPNWQYYQIIKARIIFVSLKRQKINLKLFFTIFFQNLIVTSASLNIWIMCMNFWAKRSIILQHVLRNDIKHIKLYIKQKLILISEILLCV